MPRSRSYEKRADNAADGVCPKYVVRADTRRSERGASLHGVLGVKDHSEE
jgi:hypothetical protein